MFNRLSPALALFAMASGCIETKPPSGGPYTESSIDAGCKDGEDNDGDEKTDCDDTDCRWSPACRSGDSWDDWDTDWDTHERDSDDPYDTGEPGGEVSFEADWSASGLVLSVYNGSGTYTLGLVETDEASPDPWTGEDCAYGYTTGSGTVYLYCHPLSSLGGALSSVSSVDQIVEGETTIFREAFEDVITYAVWSDITGDCWVWGHEWRYYAGLGCTVLE